MKYNAIYKIPSCITDSAIDGRRQLDLQVTYLSVNLYYCLEQEEVLIEQKLKLSIRLDDTKRHLETAFLYITKNLLICLDILFVY